jgi:hypothetical protein
MRTRTRGARLFLALLVALAAGATALGGLGLLAETAYAQKALCPEEGCGMGTGGSSCTASAWGCSCACTGYDSNLYITQCTCGTPICRKWDGLGMTCLAREITCACACPGQFESNICPV